MTILLDLEAMKSTALLFSRGIRGRSVNSGTYFHESISVTTIYY